MPEKRGKLQAVASRAGVSIKTVSRVLNNEKYVRESTREKVTKAIEELNYKPTRAAQQLRGSKSFNIAIIYEPPGTEFLNGVMEGVFPVCNAADYHVLLEPIPKTGKPDYIERLISRSHLDGAILLPPESENKHLIEALNKANVKCIAIESSIDELSTIGIDNEAAGFLLGQHFLERGHQEFAYIALSKDRTQGNQRLVGFKAALKQAGVPMSKLTVKQGDCSLESGYGCAKSLLKRKNPPTAIFAGNDHMAIGVMSCAKDLGIEVPDELAVCGFDDTEISRIFSPNLTTVRQPLNQYGAVAAETILRAINGSEVDTQNEVIPFEVFYRRSTELSYEIS